MNSAKSNDSNPADDTPTGPPTMRGFWSLFIAQFQGAFSDNVFKWLVIFIVWEAYTDTQRDGMVAVIGAIFALPFILFSMAGGFLADRFSKRSVAIGTKIAEVGTMTLGLIGLALVNIPLLMAVIFLMSTQSAFFGPTKYGLMPELLPERQLSWGNGILSLGTFTAIILGMVAAGWLSDQFAGQPGWSGAVLIGLALTGLLASMGISRVPPANRQKAFRLNFLGDLWSQIQLIRRDRVLALAVTGSVYFWFFGALLQPTVFYYGKQIFDLTDFNSGLLQATLSVGIGFGSGAAGFLSGKKIEYGLVPLGALGLTLVAGLAGIPGYTHAGFSILLALLGFFGGFYIVPINALIQHRPAPETKGAVLGANALLCFTGICLSAGVFYFLSGVLDFSPAGIFLTGSVMTLAGTIYVLWLIPDSLLRLLFWMLTHSLYRLKVVGRDHIPEKGGALFVCNHLSLVDAFLLIASTDRHIRFLQYRGYYEKWWVKPFAKALKVIPISSEMRPREMLNSLNEASEWIRGGEVVCIFAEGQISRIGQMLPFRKGMQRIMKGVDAPVIPVHLDGVWGSIFSFEQGRFLWKMPRQIPYPVTVSYGRPLPPDVKPVEVRQAVQDLGAEAWIQRKPRLRTLHRSLLRTARLHPFRFAMTDSTSPRLSFGSVLMKTVFLARRLKAVWKDQPRVGILLPPSVPGALVNYAALLMGKVPVNLNYTVSEETLASCLNQCEIQSVVTSRKFMDRLNLNLPVEAVYLEDLARNPTAVEKLAAAVLACLMPAPLLERTLGRKTQVGIDDLATIIFSSGSTGEPKGVMLSHYNIASNVDQMGQTFGLTKRDCLLGVLPFFHSFGFTATLALPAALGMGVVYHVNPLEARIIGPLIQKNAVTFLLATPTFLQIYLRGCQPEQLRSVVFVMVGAEKLTERLAVAFEKRFGICPVEGYGCTECAPAVAVNTRDFSAAGLRQVGTKRGKIGHPLPGVSVRIVDPDTRAPVPIGQAGLLLVKGPNVMQGYWKRPDKTAEVLQDGWYITGDIAALDEDGFLTITDRLSRFSKIGGEMVPHIKVEEQLHHLAGATEQCFAVTGLPDEKKGERLIVLHTLPEKDLAACLEKLAQADLPNLWKPRTDQFFKVESLPHLGTGKLDLRSIRELAKTMTDSQ